MVNIKNTELKTTVNTIHLKKDAHCILNLLDYSDFDLGIMLCDNKKIQQFNRDYRDKDQPTDILAFPYHNKLKPGERIKPTTREDRNLGDLIISLEYVKQDCPKWNQTFPERMRVLLIHGVCHLLGYDHQTDEEYTVMKEKEDWLLEHTKNHDK